MIIAAKLRMVGDPEVNVGSGLLELLPDCPKLHGSVSNRPRRKFHCEVANVSASTIIPSAKGEKLKQKRKRLRMQLI